MAACPMPVIFLNKDALINDVLSEAEVLNDFVFVCLLESVSDGGEVHQDTDL